ncbi:hypothetical protein LZ31DRAFT_67932 [Colletotrichum somersetense]|nr:hypothetical protein LZ31DRAFT_67932 [Colletotrichum somersetense]
MKRERGVCCNTESPVRTGALAFPPPVCLSQLPPSLSLCLCLFLSAARSLAHCPFPFHPIFVQASPSSSIHLHLLLSLSVCSSHTHASFSLTLSHSHLSFSHLAFPAPAYPPFSFVQPTILYLRTSCTYLLYSNTPPFIILAFPFFCLPYSTAPDPPRCQRPLLLSLLASHHPLIPPPPTSLPLPSSTHPSPSSSSPRPRPYHTILAQPIQRFHPRVILQAISQSHRLRRRVDCTSTRQSIDRDKREERPLGLGLNTDSTSLGTSCYRTPTHIRVR